MTRDTTCNGGVMAHDADTTRIIPADGGLIEREAALSAICSHARYDDDWGDLVEAVCAIPAAQPAQRVKPLVWDDDGVAEALGLRYILSDPSYSYTGGWEVLEETTNTPMPDTDGSAEDAKAAAQADYERRILSAIEPAAEDEAGDYPPEPEVACAEATGDAISRLRRAAREIDPTFAGHHENIDFAIQRLRDLTQSFLDACRANDALTAERDALKAEVARLRDALTQCLDYCRNSGRGNALVNDRIYERVEETCCDALAIGAEQKGDA